MLGPTLVVPPSPDRPAVQLLPPSRTVAMRSWLLLVASTGARVVLISAATLLLWSAIPAVWGWIPTTISSDSMAPRVRTGDVVVAMPVTASSARIGQVLLVDDPDHPNRLRFHRFIGVQPNGDFVLQGDANPAPDSTPVEQEAVRGVGFLRIPYVGFPGLWLRNGQVLALIVTGIAVVVLLVLARLTARPRRSTIDSTPGGDAGSGLVPDETTDTATPVDTSNNSTAPDTSARVAPPRIHLTAKVDRPRIRATLLPFVAALVLSGLAVGTASAGAAFNSTTANPSSTLQAGSPYDCYPTPAPPDNPYLYYRFTESGSSAVDASSNPTPQTGTLQGTAPNTRAAGSCPPGVNPALGLDGISGFLSAAATITAITAPPQFSVEIWFKTTTTRGGKLIGFGSSRAASSGSYDRHVYMLNSGQLVFGVYDGAQKTITSPVAINDGAWHHVVALLGSTGNVGMQLYVDGQLVASDRKVTTAQSYSGFWRYGYDNLNGWVNTAPGTAAASFYFAGTIDDAAVYNTVLSPAQITSHFNAGR